MAKEKRCWYCGVILIPFHAPVSGGLRKWPPFATVDHQTPIRKGGTDAPDNRVDACLGCNASKRGQTVEEYRFTLWARTEPGLTVKRLRLLAKSSALSQEQISTLLNIAASIEAQHILPVFWGERNG